MIAEKGPYDIGYDVGLSDAENDVLYRDNPHGRSPYNADAFDWALGYEDGQHEWVEELRRREERK
jgi:hypothetical protein